MGCGQIGETGHSVPSLVVEAFRNEIGHASLPSTMADGARAMTLL